MKLYTSDGIGYVQLLDGYDTHIDRLICDVARVSFNNQNVKESREKNLKLINYLAKNGHQSPFFHPQLRFQINLPLFVARQWMKSTIGISYNEVSRRYVNFEPQIHIPQSLRLSATNKKQGSSEIESPCNTELLIKMKEHYKKSLLLYNELLENEICPEQAREVLPVSHYTTIIMTCSLQSLMRIYKLRSHEHAQKEIQEFATIINKIMKNIKNCESWNIMKQY